ncbi:MAG: Gfo/Idh/MocA family oxidoreductase [Opitutaceae bacterium]
MTDKGNIGFAIVGTGAIAETHATAIGMVEGAELRAVFNRNGDKARAFAREFGSRVEADLPSLLAAPDIDVVCVTTPSGAHEEIAVPALESGKHVLCEKPLEINLERVDRMIAAARRNGRLLAAVFPSRLGIGARTVKAAMEAGRFGRLTLCSAYIKWWRSQAYYDEGGWHGTWALDGGGAMMNQAIHYVDLLQWLVGMPGRVHAFAGSLAHERIEVEDTLVASVQYANGALGVIECATSCSPGYARRIEICGDQGSIILEDDTIKQWDFADELPGDEEIRKGRVSSGLKGGTADPRAVSCEGHRLQIVDLIHALREGRPPAIPGEDGRHAVAIVRAAYESAQTGQVVELAD